MQMQHEIKFKRSMPTLLMLEIYLAFAPASTKAAAPAIAKIGYVCAYDTISVATTSVGTYQSEVNAPDGTLTNNSDIDAADTVELGFAFPVTIIDAQYSTEGNTFKGAVR